MSKDDKPKSLADILAEAQDMLDEMSEEDRAQLQEWAEQRLAPRREREAKKAKRRHCAQCGKYLEPHQRRSPYCSRECKWLYQEAQGDQTPEAVQARKKKRRREVLRLHIHSQIDEDEFDRLRAWLQEQDLWS